MSYIAPDQPKDAEALSSATDFQVSSAVAISALVAWIAKRPSHNDVVDEVDGLTSALRQLIECHSPTQGAAVDA